MRNTETPKHRNTVKQGLIVLIFIINNSLLFAQSNQLSNWVIPPNQVSFISSTPIVSPTPQGGLFNGNAPQNVLNSMQDYEGNLLFFVSDEGSQNICRIFDKDGNIIDDFKLNGNTNFTGGIDFSFGHELSIVPVPGSLTKYYLITTYVSDLVHSSKGPKFLPVFAILDMSLPNINYPLKYGALIYNTAATNTNVYFDLVTQVQNLYPLEYVALFDNNGAYISGLAVVERQSAPCKSYFLFVLNTRKSGSFPNVFTEKCIYRYIIDDTGIHFDNGASDTGRTLVGGGANSQFTEMEAVKLPNGDYNLAFIKGEEYVKIYNINPNGVAFGVHYMNLSQTLPFSLKGLEFSPSGDYLYYTYIDGSGGGFGYVNCTTNPGYTRTNLTGYQFSQDLGNSFVEMAYDNKMYFNLGDRLIALNNPNSLQTNANVINWEYNTPVILDPGSNGTYTTILPDQIDGFDYHTDPFVVTYTAGTQGTANYTTYANTNQVWEPTNNPFSGSTSNPVSTVTVLDKLIIPPGFNITIKNMTFKFKPRTGDGSHDNPVVYGACAQIKNNASAAGKLTLNNSTFTNGTCKDGLWEGVEVWGNTGQVQNASQALFTMNTNSVVANAWIGAYMGQKNNYSSGSPLANTSGGKITTNGATFRNNYIDVKFHSYNIANSLSSFRYTTFVTDAQLNRVPLLAPFAHVFLIDTKNIQFKTCTFKNAVPAIYPVTTTAGYGIYSNNTQFFCNYAIANANGIGMGCTFENLRYGINATATATKTVTADQCVFRNCYRGAFIGNVTTPTFTRNKFFIYEQNNTPSPNNTNNAAYGLYLDYSTGFKVTENKFYYNSYNEITQAPVGGTYNVYGCIVNQSNPSRTCHTSTPGSGYNGDQIYKNEFKEIYIATQAQGANSEHDISTTLGGGINLCYGLPYPPTTRNNVGLKYDCNNFLGIDKYNIRVTDYSLISGATGNIAYQQGTEQKPAGNRFSHDAGYTTNEIYFDATFATYNPNDIKYQYFGLNALANRTEPLYKTPYGGNSSPTGVSTQPISLSLDATRCLSITSVSPVNRSFTAIKQSQDIIDAKSLILQNGDNQALVDVIATGTNGQILSDLMAKSPYLSDRVLIAALNKQLPPGQVKQIIVANSPVTQTVKSALNAVSLPAGIRNQINAAQTGISEREKIENIISDNLDSKGFYYNEIIRYFLNDTLNQNGLDSIIKVVKDFDAPDNLCAVAKAYLAKGDYVKAQQAVNDASSAGICNYLNTLIKIAQQPDNMYAIKNDILLRAEVAQIAADEEEAMSVAAKGILVMVLDSISLLEEVTAIANDAPAAASDLSIFQWMQDNPFQEWLEPFHPERRRTIAQEAETNITITDFADISIYPNPANSILNISYQLPDDATQATVNTYDYTGKLVQSQIIYGNKGFATFTTDGLNNGLYLFTIAVNNSIIISTRIVINK